MARQHRILMRETKEHTFFSCFLFNDSENRNKHMQAWAYSVVHTLYKSNFYDKGSLSFVCNQMTAINLYTTNCSRYNNNHIGYLYDFIRTITFGAFENYSRASLTFWWSQCFSPPLVQCVHIMHFPHWEQFT